MARLISQKAWIVAVCGALVTSGCENLSTTEAGLIAAGIAGSATGIALGTTGVPAGAAIPISIGAAAGAGAIAAGASSMQVAKERRTYTENLGRALVEKARRNGAADIPRYILVDTITTSPKSGRAVLVFDTYQGRVSSDRVYYTSQPPGDGGLTPAGGLR
jgi:hypothetical protein